MSCPNCQAMADRGEKVAERNEAFQDEVVEARRKIGFLQGELTKRDKFDVPAADVRFVFDCWRLQCGHERTVELGPARTKLIAAALAAKWCGRDRALKAIRGASRFRYTSSRGRVAAGPAGQRYDELERILKDEVEVGKFCALADRADREDGLSTDSPPWPAEVLGGWPSFDELGPRPAIKEWWSGCPVCALPLRVRWLDQGAGGFEVRCVGRCDPALVLGRCEELRDGEQRVAA